MAKHNNIVKKSMLPLGSVIRGTYRIDGYLSSGGFGNTYVATHVNFNERYALKEFFMKGASHRGSDSITVSVSNEDKEHEFNEQLKKFKKEAQRLRRLKNDHIVRVHDLFEENGTAYYVMDYIDGENLKDHLERTKSSMSEAEVNGVLRQILDALREVHAQGIWHMDLKPANVMLDSNGVVKLIDFGASKQFDIRKGGALSTSAVTFTNGYAPIEQMERSYEKFGPWTDFYALGATLYNLLTSRRPPMPSDINDDITADKRIALPMPGTISTRMCDLVLWLMRPNRVDRPSSVEQIFNYLDNPSARVPFLTTDAGETIITRPPQIPDPIETQAPSVLPSLPLLSKFLKKMSTKMLMAIIAMAVTGVVLLIGIFAWLGKLVTTAEDTFLEQVMGDMVLVKGGTFMMGATSEQDIAAFDDESPIHQVTLSDYYISKYEVTQELWQEVMDSNPSEFREDLQCPVENVSWNDCIIFIRKLNTMTGKQFRLPTEAEWEYAARGGNKSLGFISAGSDVVDEVAWYKLNSGEKTHPVGMKESNELGLYDMSGNVLEWCEDWYGKYSSESQLNPTGSYSNYRVFRGGGWDSSTNNCRVSFRGRWAPENKGRYLGFRLALSL